MKYLSSILLIGMLCLIGTAFVSCVGTAPTKEVHLIDSLNQAAYAYRYKNLDSSCHAASKAYRGSETFTGKERRKLVTIWDSALLCEWTLNRRRNTIRKCTV